MIIFLYGPDDFRREQKKKSIIEEFKKKHSGLGIGFFDFREDDAMERFREFTRAQSIFENSKLAILENAFSAEGGSAFVVDNESAEKLAPILKNVLEEKKMAVLLSGRDTPIKKFNFLVAEPTMFQKFGHLSGVEWRRFIVSEGKKLGVILNQSVLELLSNVHQNNSWGLVTELQKLSNVGHESITKEDIERLSLEVAPNYWAVMSSLRSQYISSRLSALDKLFAQNEPPPKIFNILASQWREKTPEMAEYDLMVKSGKLEYEEALVDLIV